MTVGNPFFSKSQDDSELVVFTVMKEDLDPGTSSKNGNNSPAPAPAAVTAASSESHRQFINRAVSFTLLENIFKPISPVLEIICAGLFVGGDWGRYKFYESFVYLLFRISLMGMDKGVIWYYAQVDEKLYLKTIFRSLSWCFVAFGLLGLITFGSYLGWIPYSNWLLGKNSEAFHVSNFGLIAYLLVVPMMVISEICIQANVNKKNLRYRILVPGITVPLVTFGLAILGRFFVAGGISLPLCLLTGNTVGAFVAVFGFFQVHRPKWSDLSFYPMPPWKLVRYSFPLASANIFAAVAVRIDIFMLAGMAGLQSVEIYSVVCMIGRSLTSIRQSFENILLSSFSSWAKNIFSAKLKHYFNYSIWLVMNVESLFLVFALFFGAELLGLISHQYMAGYWVLISTALFIYINTITDFSIILSMGLGRTTIVPIVQAAFLALNLALNYLLIPRFDAMGAAVALGLANFAAGLIYLIYLGVYYKTMPLMKEYWLSIFWGACIFGLPGLLAVYLHLILIWKIVLFLVCALVGYTVQKTWYRRFNRQLKLLN